MTQHCVPRLLHGDASLLVRTKCTNLTFGARLICRQISVGGDDARVGARLTAPSVDDAARQIHRAPDNDRWRREIAAVASMAATAVLTALAWRTLEATPALDKRALARFAGCLQSEWLGC